MSNQPSEALETAENMNVELARLRSENAELHERIRQLDRLAHEDALVGLPNRRGFMRQLQQLIERVRRYRDTAALLFIDLDGLKMINDSLGHPAGDEALVQVAERLVQGVRASDCVARLGGDEFAVLLERVDETGARETARRLVDRVAEGGFVHNGTAMPLSVAIGVALISEVDRPEDVIARADAEMYEAKLAG